MDLVPLFITELIEKYYIYGYSVFFVLAFLESFIIIGLFIPGIASLLLIGFIISEGYYNFWLVALVMIMGAILADIINFIIGRREIEVFKKITFLNGNYLKATTKYFENHGGKSVFTGKFIGPVRVMISFIAGLTKMKVKRFICFNWLTNIVWVFVYLTLGYFFGQSWQIISKGSEVIGLSVTLIVAVTLLIIWFRRKKKYDIHIKRKKTKK